MYKLLLATVAGAVTAAVLGFLIFGLVMGPFFAANVGSATGVSKDPPALVWVFLARLPLALMLALAISKWGDSTSLAGGARVGAIFGFLVTAGFDLTMYGMTNLSNLTATLVGIVVSTAVWAVEGAVIGSVLGRGSE